MWHIKISLVYIVRCSFPLCAPGISTVCMLCSYSLDVCFMKSKSSCVCNDGWKNSLHSLTRSPLAAGEGVDVWAGGVDAWAGGVDAWAGVWVVRCTLNWWIVSSTRHMNRVWFTEVLVGGASFKSYRRKTMLNLIFMSNFIHKIFRNHNYYHNCDSQQRTVLHYNDRSWPVLTSTKDTTVQSTKSMLSGDGSICWVSNNENNASVEWQRESHDESDKLRR